MWVSAWDGDTSCFRVFNLSLRDSTVGLCGVTVAASTRYAHLSPTHLRQAVEGTAEGRTVTKKEEGIVSMERETGFEPATLALARRCSTAELFPPFWCELTRIIGTPSDPVKHAFTGVNEHNQLCLDTVKRTVIGLRPDV